MKKRAPLLFLGKKADTNAIYHMLIQVLVALAVYWALHTYIDNVAEDTLFEKYYISNDLGLLADAIYAAPGDITYSYSNDEVKLEKFSVDFKQQRVRIVETEGNLPLEQPYGEDKNASYSGQEIYGKDTITFTKTKDRLEIR